MSDIQMPQISNGVNTKTFLFIGIVIMVIVGITLFLRGDMTQHDMDGNSSGLIVGKNAIYVAEQVPSKIVSVAVVHLEAPGFVVLHEDAAGLPGVILGASGFLAAGQTESPTIISLSRMTKDGETIYAMLYLDDGDGVFDAGRDRPAVDRINGEPVKMVVTVSADADEPGAVNP